MCKRENASGNNYDKNERHQKTEKRARTANAHPRFSLCDADELFIGRCLTGERQASLNLQEK
jgi:hypothetical protein